jgi:hypothetical protein
LKKVSVSNFTRFFKNKNIEVFFCDNIIFFYFYNAG